MDGYLSLKHAVFMLNQFPFPLAKGEPIGDRYFYNRQHVANYYRKA
jgi:hypothetical protein